MFRLVTQVHTRNTLRNSFNSNAMMTIWKIQWFSQCVKFSQADYQKILPNRSRYHIFPTFRYKIDLIQFYQYGLTVLTDILKTQMAICEIYDWWSWNSQSAEIFFLALIMTHLKLRIGYFTDQYWRIFFRSLRDSLEEPLEVRLLTRVPAKWTAPDGS